MRMWMVDPRVLCRQHLLGEHGELHKFRHVFVRGWSIAGRRGQIEPKSMKRRHDALAREMVARGYRHASPYRQPSLAAYGAADRNGKVDKRVALEELVRRCPRCAEMINNKGGLR